MRKHGRCGLVNATDHGDAVDKVIGFELSADDSVTKPFDPRELLARIKAVLRRLTPSDAPAAARGKLCFACWEADTRARLLRNPQGQHVALSRDLLLEQTRGREAGPYDRAIDVQAGRLRKKIEVDADNPQFIKSVRGVGCILLPSVIRV